MIGNITETQKTFYLQEYKKLSDELAWMMNHANSLLQYVILASAAVLTWIFTQSIGVAENHFCYKIPKNIVDLVLWIPFSISLLAFLVAIASQYKANEIGKYLREIEKKFDVDGWEKHLSNLCKWPTLVVFICWVALLVGTFNLVQNHGFFHENETQICTSKPAPS